MKTDTSGGPEGVNRRHTGGKEGRNIVGGEVIQRFEGMNKGAELDALSDRKPMELIQKRRRMREFWFLENKAGTPVLNPLKTGYVFLGNTIQESTTVVQSGQDEGADGIVTRVEIQKPSNSAEISDLEIQRARQLSDMITHLHLIIKNRTQVFNRRRRMDINII